MLHVTMLQNDIYVLHQFYLVKFWIRSNTELLRLRLNAAKPVESRPTFLQQFTSIQGKEVSWIVAILGNSYQVFSL